MSSFSRRRTLTTLGVAVVLVAGLVVGVTLARRGPDSPPDRNTLTLPAVDATSTSTDRPATPQPRGALLRASPERDSVYLKFDSSVLARVKVASATLVLTPEHTTSSQGMVVRQASPNWSGRTLTQSDMAFSLPRLGSTRAPLEAGRAVHVPVGDLQEFSPDRPIALRVNGTQPSSYTDFFAQGRHRPRLLVHLLDNSAPAPRAQPPRKVFAHYFPPYPISLDNEPAENDYYTQNYLNPDGEGGIHAAYGGLLRDRPEPRPPLPSPTWRLEDLRTEVRQAKAAGIDGFTVDILGIEGTNWAATVDLMQAAQDVGGFTVVPNVDGNGTVADQSPAAVATALAELYAYSSAQRRGGAYLLSSFAAERRPPSWWRAVTDDLRKVHNVPTRFIAVFLDASRANLEAYAPVAFGFGNWGVRTVADIDNSPDRAAWAHALGRVWMAPVAFQDARPREGLYAEASNTETGRAAWARAIEDRADYVQIVTWNDYSESTQVAPSAAHGEVLLQICAYDAQWFRSGSPPAITRDRVLLTHRNQFWEAQTSSGISMSPTLGGASAHPRDTVEALTFLTAPAQITLTVGEQTTTYSLPAGLSAVTVPLQPGSVQAEVRRGSKTVASVTSPHEVLVTPTVPDLQYFAAGSDEGMRP